MEVSYVGKQIGSYILKKVLGRGRFACVYLAEHNSYDYAVAIKLLDPQYLGSPIEQDFLQEAVILQHLRQLKHPHILSFLDFGESEGTRYIIAEYAPGGTLRERIRGAPQVTEQAVTILAQVGEAVYNVHQQNIVHCDLKPEGILFNKDDDVILADFGIAIQLPLGSHTTTIHDIRGTYLYMAPEQFDGIITKWGDQYSLGCIAYELFTGRYPFSQISSLESDDPRLHDPKYMKNIHESEPPRNLRELNKDLPEYIDQAILKALAKKPEERHSSVDEFINSLQLTTTFPVGISSGGSRMPSQTQAASPRRLRVFLCHSSGDKLAVQNIYWRLKACNVDPWLDKEKILPGQDWDLEIQKAMRRSDVILICLSKDFIIKEGYGQKEIKLALNTALEKPEGTIYLIPLKLEECELPERLKPLHAVNYFEEDGFDKLVSALKHRGKSLKEKVEPIDCQERAREFVTEQLRTTSPTDVDRYTVPLQNRDPTQDLLDLRLPRVWLDLLAPTLLRLGLTLTEEVARDEYASIRRMYTMVRNKMGQRRALLYVPGWILENANTANVHAISNVGSAFPKGSVLIIFSDTSKLPARAIRKIMEVRWLDERQVRVIFVPWQDIEELRGMEAEDQEHWIADQLKFQESFEEPKKPMSVQQMDAEDNETLVQIVANIPYLIDEPGRGVRVLLQSADLDEIVSEIDLKGPSRAIAWGLVNHLKRRARLSRHPDYEVLGLMLCYILTLGDLPPKDCESIKQIIRKYVLVPPSRSL